MSAKGTVACWNIMQMLSVIQKDEKMTFSRGLQKVLQTHTLSSRQDAVGMQLAACQVDI